MSISRFRHTQCVPARYDKQFFDVNPTGAIWDCSNMIACSDRFIAVPWAQPGSTAVLRHSDYGRIAHNLPLLAGHEAPVIDVTFNPFDSTKLFTASEDCTVMGWNIPEAGLTQSLNENIVHLRGHSKKVGIMSFHPSASNVLASAGADMVVNLWDVGVGKAGTVLRCHTDQIMALDWNLDGSLFCSTTKDKKLNVVDARGGNIVNSGTAHQGGKTQRCVWAKRLNFIITTGFSKSQSRQILLWDTRNMSSALQTENFDQTISVTLPFFDEDTNMLYIGSKGDGGICSFEVISGELVQCAAHRNLEPHKGLCMLPKWSLDTRQCEIARFYALTSKSVYSIQMLLPRKMAENELQTDVYPPTFADKPAITAEEYFNGGSSEPFVIDMHDVFDGSKREARRANEETPAKTEKIDVMSTRSQLSQAVTPAKVFNNACFVDGSFLALRDDEENAGIVTDDMTQLGQLFLELEKQQDDVRQCRAELEEKERRVTDTISKICLIASRKL